MADVPRVLILAGPNGAGKTTAARSILADTLDVMTYVNADVIASGLSGFDPESVAFEAGRIMLERLHQLADQRMDFAFETTLAGRAYVSWLRTLQANGYRVILFYCWLSEVDLAVRRVALRVAQGGHTIPEATIRQRYARSRTNFQELYRSLVDEWVLYDNSLESSYRLVATGSRLEPIQLIEPELWATFAREAP